MQSKLFHGNLSVIIADYSKRVMVHNFKIVQLAPVSA